MTKSYRWSLSVAGVLDFYFDFSSPYGYLASERIEALAAKHNLSLNWHPILLGFIFPLTGQKPLVDFPLIDQYSLHDFDRSAREHGISYRHPTVFPVNTIPACRAVYWTKKSMPEKTAELIHALYRAYFSNGEAISSADDVFNIVKQCGLDGSGIEVSNQDPQIKANTKEAMDTAISRGVFGSPFFLVNDEPFWGNDRLDQIERWLTCDGW